MVEKIRYSERCGEGVQSWCGPSSATAARGAWVQAEQGGVMISGFVGFFCKKCIRLSILCLSMQKLNRCHFSKEKVPQKCHFSKIKMGVKCHFSKNLVLGRGIVLC
jgi:hypothetical protein